MSTETICSKLVPEIAEDLSEISFKYETILSTKLSEEYFIDFPLVNSLNKMLHNFPDHRIHKNI